MLSVKNLTFTYNGAPEAALQDVSLELEAGDFVLLCGPSGCGKTTLLRLIKRELAPYGQMQGSITLEGIWDAGRVGFVMQNPENQVVSETVLQELAFGAENLGYPRDVIARKVAETAAYFGLEDWLCKETAHLSGGEKQILNLAACMVCSPDVLLLDEPTAMLDPIATTSFLSLLRKVNEELGVTVLMTEHRLEEVLPMANRLVLLEEGRVAAASHPQDIGDLLCKRPTVLGSMPASVQIHTLLSGRGEVPLTVRAGRKYLKETYSCHPGHLDLPERKVPEGTPLLEGKNLYFRYTKDGKDVLSGLSVTVRPGECLGIVGGNGAGKSTLLKVLAGVSKPYSGKIRGVGTVSMLPQNPRLVFLAETLREDYHNMLNLMGIPKTEWETRIGALAAMLGLSHLLDRHPYDLSGGEQQKAALGKVLLREPQVLLLDEPTKGLDSESRQILGLILKDLQGKGMGIVLVTHDLDFCSQYATSCGLLSGGTLVGEGEPHGFFSKNRFYTTAAYRIGSVCCDNGITPSEVAAFLQGREAGT